MEGIEHSKKALIIQEDVIMRKILESLLESLNYRSKSVKSFTDINLEDQHMLFDIVLTDILFDGISPIEFVLQIQESINTNKLIVVTNMGQEKIKEEVLALHGINGFFGIPFDLDLLENQLRNL